MRINVNVSVDCQGDHCSTSCPYFRLEQGASFERPVVEYCKLFNKDLKTEGNKTLRCPSCHEEERNWPAKMRRFVMDEACRDKAAARKLLQLTGYKLDIWECASPKELMVKLIDEHKLGAEVIKEVLGLDQNTLDLILKGVEYPFIIQPLQQKIGFPRPRPLGTREFV